MRHIKWYSWLGIAVLFLIATVLFVKVFNTVGHMAHTETINVKVESEKIDHQIQLETETKEAGKLTAVKSIPYTKIEKIDKPIKKWANKEEETFFANMKEADLLLDYKADAHFSVKSKVMTLKDDTYNIRMTAKQSAEQESDYETTKTFTIDLDKEDFVTFDKMTKESLTPNKLLKVLKKNSDAELSKDIFLDKFDSIADLNWTADEENIVFYFNPKEISKNKEKVTVPLMSFYPYLNEDYYDAFINEKLDKKIKQKEEEARKKKEEEERKKQAALNNKKLVALTFDDGPHPENTPKILDALKEYDAKATFFNLSNNVKEYPELTKRIVDEGHELGNHSVSHANLNAVKKDDAKHEIFDSQKVIEEQTGKTTKLFRPPYGNFQDDTKQMIYDSDQEIIMWSVDTQDWKSKNANTVLQTAKTHIVPGSIVLMHDIHPTTADAVPKILKYLKDEGYEFVTVSELMPYIEDTNNGAYFGH